MAAKRDEKIMAKAKRNEGIDEELYLIDEQTNEEFELIVSSEDATRARNGKKMNKIQNR